MTISNDALPRRRAWVNFTLICLVICEIICTFALRMGEFNNIAQMLALLHELQGAAFSRQVESIALHAVFTPYKASRPSSTEKKKDNK